MASMPETIINIVTVEGAKLTLAAGDTLVLTLSHAPTNDQVEALTAHATKALPEGVKVMVLGGGIGIAAVTANGGNSLMCEIKTLREEIRQLRRAQDEGGIPMCVVA